jgi:hypothetical protein
VSRRLTAIAIYDGAVGAAIAVTTVGVRLAPGSLPYLAAFVGGCVAAAVGSVWTFVYGAAVAWQAGREFALRRGWSGECRHLRPSPRRWVAPANPAPSPAETTVRFPSPFADAGDGYLDPERHPAHAAPATDFVAS